MQKHVRLAEFGVCMYYAKKNDKIVR